MKKFENKELIIFDLDGTLINSIPDLTNALNEMLHTLELPLLTIEQTTPFVGNGAKPLVKRAIQYSTNKEDVNQEYFDNAFFSYMSAYKKSPSKDTYLYPGVVETLKYLKSKNYKMVICTNKPFEFVEPILTHLEIKDFFEEWIGEDSLEHKKPSKEPLIYLAKKMNTSTDHTVMIGDSKNDILAAKNAQMDSIGVSYGYNYNENIMNYDPTVVINKFSEIQDLF